MTKRFIQDFNNKIQGGDNLNDWGEIKTVEQPKPDESYFIEDTIKELSKRGKVFQGRIDVYNTIREVMNDLDEYSAYVGMFTLLSTDQEQTREIQGLYNEYINTLYNLLKEIYNGGNDCIIYIENVLWGFNYQKQEPKQDDHDYIYYKELMEFERELDRLTIKDVPQRMQKKLDYYKLLFDDEKDALKDMLNNITNNAHGQYVIHIVKTNEKGLYKTSYGLHGYESDCLLNANIERLRLNDLSYRELMLYTEYNDLTLFFSSTYSVMRELTKSKPINDYYNDMINLIKELQQNK